MIKCLLWGTGDCFRRYYSNVKLFEIEQKIEVVGITSNVTYFSVIRGVTFINKSEIAKVNYDYVIVMAEGIVLRDICNEAETMGISDDIIVPIKVMSLPGFDFEKYKRIRQNPPTLISPNCWGGITYNSLQLEFTSPFINMFESHADYLKMLSNLSYYLACPLEFDEMIYEKEIDREYPIARLGDVKLYLNHYCSFEDAKACWDRRIGRIDANNLIVMFFDERPELIEEFLKLNFERKICFSTEHMGDSRVISLDYKKRAPNKKFREVTIDAARGDIYDIFELILNNTMVPVSTF